MSGTDRYGLPTMAGFVVLTAINIISVTMLIWLAANGRSVFVVFPFSAGAWGCYMSSHYLLEGEFIDESGSETDRESRNGLMDSLTIFITNISASPTRGLLAVSGVTGMLLTFPTGILAVGNNNFTLMLVSATLFIGGYVIGHQGVTGKPL